MSPARDGSNSSSCLMVKIEKALQNLTDGGVMTPEHMLTPNATLDAIGTTIKSEEHF